VIFFGAVSAFAADLFALTRTYGTSDLRLTLLLTEKEITVAESFKVTLTAQFPEDCTVSFPDFKNRWGGLRVATGVLLPPEVAGKGRIGQSLNITLAPVLSGSYTLPPLEVSFSCQDAQPTVVATDEVRVEVLSLLPSDPQNAKLRDIMGRVGSPQANWWIGGSILLMLIIIAGALIAVVRRKMPTPVP
jgi:hypothetical protein